MIAHVDASRIRAFSVTCQRFDTMGWALLTGAIVSWPRLLMQHGWSLLYEAQAADPWPLLSLRTAVVEGRTQSHVPPDAVP